jgi:Flp pilus assembly protein TadD
VTPWLILAAVSAANAPPPAAAVDPQTLLKGASQAVEAGRLEQARLMTERAVAAGATGASVDRLLADLAYASGHNAEAFARYQALLRAAPDDPSLLERSGISALKAGDLANASRLLARASASAGASWRVWNGRGVIADLDRDWASADEGYQHALDLAPERAEVLNNLGWSQLLRGNWLAAVQHFERAAALDPTSERIANNLELARTALAADLPKRRDGEADDAWAYRLNDAGVAAEILGDKPRAIAAFSRALEASDRWYDRAANNLEAVSR